MATDSSIGAPLGAGSPGAGYGGTSTTSVAIPGSVPTSVTLTTQAGLAYTTASRVRVAKSDDAAKWMDGNVTAYNNSTGELTFLCDVFAGTGTYATWAISLLAGSVMTGVGDLISATTSGAPVRVAAPTTASTQHLLSSTPNGSGDPAVPVWVTAASLGLPASGGALPYVILADEKSSGTNGGTFTASGVWRTRTLNTERADSGGNCTLSSNQFTLAAGTYYITAEAPARAVLTHQLRLQNTTAGTTLLTGQNACTDTSSIQTLACLDGVFTVAAGQALELQHQCGSSKSSDGFGVACGFGTEVYAVVKLWKLS